MARPVNGVDDINIVITADAREATVELDKLSKSIDTLSNSLRGANLLPFTNSVKELKGALKGINMSPLNSQMNKLNNAMSRYGQGTKRTSTFTKEFAQSFRALKRGFNDVYDGLNRINNKLTQFALKIRSAHKESRNFVQTVGLLYAKFWLLIRGIKALTTAVKSSMNYIEVLNYFEASFGQVAERGVEKWSEMGYDSAEAYYNSFQERAKKVTADMSGFFPEKNGTLTPTGMKSLGMNPQQLMQYQSQFAQMASSMGTTSEQALKLSEVLTKIGADIASVKNMEFEDVWKDMASGLVGMSRTLDKYGANIRNANMEMKLHELGIDATVKSLSQADKALLRTIILLDSTTYAWADLAETLDTPANQFRMLTNNIKLLGQMIGNIFLPIVAKILPYLNALVIALQRLFTWLAKILGIDLTELMGKNQGYDNSNLSDILDDAEDLSGALDDDTNSAKKLKKQLQGFDALNNLTTNEDKDKGKDSALTSGLLNDAFLDAVDRYLKAWQDAYDQLKNKAEKIADKIQAFFVRLTKPIADAWAKVGQKVKTQWANFGYNLKWLFKRIGKDFWKVWEQPATVKVFENILSAIGNIGEALDWITKRFHQAWVDGDNGFKILEGIRNLFLTISDYANQMSESIKNWARSLDLKPLLSKFAEFIKSMNPVISSLLGILKDFLDKVLLPLAKWTLEEGLPKLLQVFIDFKDRVDWIGLRKKFSDLWDHLAPFSKKVGEGFIIFLNRIGKALGDFLNSKEFEDFLNKLKKWMDDVSAEDIADFFEKFAKALVAFRLAMLALSVLAPVIKIISGLAKVIYGLFKAGKGIVKVVRWLALLKSSAVGTGAIAMMTANLSDLGAVFSEIAMEGGTKLALQSVGATIGATIIGGVVASIAGFHFGKWIGKKFAEEFKPEDVKYYTDFHWTGEGGFFEALADEVEIETDRMKTNFSNGLEFIKNKALEHWDIVGESGLSKFLNDTKGQVELFKTSMSTFWDDQKEQTNAQYEWLKDWKDNKIKPLFSKESWFITTGGMSEGFKQTLDDMKKKYEESSFKKWIDEKVKPLFTKEYWIGIFENMVIGFSLKNSDLIAKMNNLQTNITRIVQNIVNALAKVTGAIRDTRNQLTQLGHTPIRTTLSFPKATLHANGGFPEDGLFFANHNELVGQFTNGKTAVANNEQIVSGIQNGVYGAMSESNALLMEQNVLLQAILEKESGISASDIFKSVQRSASNYSKQYGKPAFS